MRFSPAQQKAIQIRDKNVLVFASAGSGKTSVLVQRLCDLVLKDKISIDSILAMTFTKDAANEMKTRLQIALEQQKPTDYIKEQLALLETSSLCTIDSFCLSVVKNYYYQIPISLKMANTTLDSSLSSELFQKAYEQACAQIDPKDMADLLHYFDGFGKKEDDLLQSVKKLIQTAWSKPRPKEWIDKLIENESSEINTWFYRTFEIRIQSMMILLESIMEQVEDTDDLLTKHKDLSNCLKTLKDQDYASFRKAFFHEINGSPRLKNKYDDIEVKDLADKFKKMEKQVAEMCFDEGIYFETNDPLQKEKKTFCTLSLKTKACFQDLKKAQEALDFEDMEHFAYQLLSQEHIAQEVRQKYRMILVDEFQDTNDLQESIVACFARENNVFRVGDIKQSIYGFRYAKPEIMASHMHTQDANSCTIVLDENYRSSDTIIRFNNDFYQKIMNVEGTSKQFSAIDLAKSGTEHQKQDPQYPVRFLYSEYKPYAQEHDLDVLKAKSAFAKNRLDILARDILKQKENGNNFRDICILTRSHGPQQAIKEALEAYDIPCLAEIDHGFYTNSAVWIILSALQAILDPEDDISLCSFLFSGLSEVSADDLAKATLHKEKGLSLYQKIKDCTFMQDYHELASYRDLPLCELIRKLYAHRSFYRDQTSPQDKTNLDLFLRMASEKEDSCSTEEFIRIHKQASDFDALAQASPYSKHADVVSIKTMHHSKGLQFPIVYILSTHEERERDASQPVLIDEKLGCSFAKVDPQGNLKYKGKSHLAFLTKKRQDELEEEMRVLYVATTRAEKELILVDAISQAEDYESPLSLYTLYQKEGPTGWFFHTYYGSQEDLVHFEKIQKLYERPESQKKPTPIQPIPVYTRPWISIHDQTASQAKQARSWPAVDLHTSTGSVRGTLFHEMAAQLSYPYQESAIQEFAQKKDYSLRKIDKHQFLSLNQDERYQKWMAKPHRFECSYIVEMNHSIVHGFMDLVIWDKEQIVILDFKTDHLDKEKDFIHAYKAQLDTYEKALSLMETKPIQKWIYSFHLQKMIQVP